VLTSGSQPATLWCPKGKYSGKGVWRYAINNREGGFSFVEVLLYLFISSLVLGGASQVVPVIWQNHQQIQNRARDLGKLVLMETLLRRAFYEVHLPYWYPGEEAFLQGISPDKKTLKLGYLQGKGDHYIILKGTDEALQCQIGDESWVFPFSLEGFQWQKEPRPGVIIYGARGRPFVLTLGGSL